MSIADSITASDTAAIAQTSACSNPPAIGDASTITEVGITYSTGTCGAAEVAALPPYLVSRTLLSVS